jgi:hypothetical protein
VTVNQVFNLLNDIAGQLSFCLVRREAPPRTKLKDWALKLRDVADVFDALSDKS